MKIIKKKLFLKIFPATFFLYPPLALAQKLANPAPGAGSTLEDFVYLLLDIMQWIAIPLLALCIIRAGFILVSAGGNEDAVTKGKLWVFYTLVGAAIVLGARVIANIVFGTASVF